MCHSKEAYGYCLKIDLLGICSLVTSSIIPVIYTGFYDKDYFWTRAVYLSALGTLAIFAAVVSCLPRFQAPENGVYRALVFFTMCCCGIIPVIHQTFHFGLEDPRVVACIINIIKVSLIYVFGVLFYALRIPERMSKTGRFDMWFSSHQIWHCFVLGAALVHFHGFHDILIEFNKVQAESL